MLLGKMFPDLEHNREMNVFSSNITHRSFVWQLTALSFVLGLILSATWSTVSQVSRAGDAPQREGLYYGNSENTDQKLQGEIKHLRVENQTLNNELAKRNGGADTLNQELKDSRKYAGLTDLVGPGIQVTLQDNKTHTVLGSDTLSLVNLIHDTDIAEVINELRAAGAEAFAVNGQRIVVTSAIRCVGPVIQVNSIPTTPPYIIQAIGDPKSLEEALALPGGILQQIQLTSPNMIRVDKMSHLHLPAFAGSTLMRFGHVPPITAQEGSKEN